MTGLALGLVLASGLLHALWNVLLAKAPRGFDTMAVANLIGFLAWLPVALVSWRIDRAAWPWLAVSAAFQILYFVVVNFAYARAPAHTAYPVARGAAPVLLLVIALLAGDGVTWWAAAGVALIGAGVLGTAAGTPAFRTVAVALPVAVSLAGYTYVTAHGLRHADAATYFWLSMIPVVSIAMLTRKPAAVRDQMRPATVAMGLGMVGAHGLTLLALAMVPPAQVPAIGALRETGILFMIALTWRQASRSAVAGAALIFAGVVVLAAG